MEVSAAIGQRKSIRAFKPDTILMSTLQQILKEAVRAPSDIKGNIEYYVHIDILAKFD